MTALTSNESFIVSTLDTNSLTKELVRKCIENNAVFVQDDYLCMREISSDPDTVRFLNRVAELKAEIRSEDEAPKATPGQEFAVGIIFKNNGTTSRQYTYKSNFRVKIGDKVLVPTSNWYSVGEVVAFSSKHQFKEANNYRFLIMKLDI